MGQNAIVIKGAREHNLKDIDLIIPRDELVVITGLSGSGKSSLAFDTMYAEGQRRYVESLSSYARMFLGQMSKPDLDSIDGLSPAVSIDQKTTSKNPRSTVGTTTEIYDYLRLLFARVGVPHCPECGRVIRKQTTDQVTDEILSLAPGAKAIVMAPVVAGRKGEFTKLFADLQKEGFSRVRIDGEILKLEAEPLTLNKKIKHFVDVVVDRVQLKESATSRIAEAVELATKLADGRVLVQVLGDDGQPLGEAGGQSSGAKGGLGEGEHIFSLALACPEHGHSMDELQPRDFSFNAPYGACPDCLGIGSREEVDPSLVVPDPVAHAGRGRHRAVQDGQLLPAGAARRGPSYGHRREHAVGGPAEEGDRRAALRLGRPEGARGLRDRGRPRDVLVHRVGGRARRGAAPLPGGPVRQPAREAVGVLRHRAVPDVRRQAPEARDPGRDGGGQVHPRRDRDERGRLARLLRGPGLPWCGGAHRRPHREGDQGAPALPGGRGPGLPHARTGHGHALGRRGAAHPPGHADRRGPHGRALHSGRAVHRPAPARQRAAHRHARAPARFGQHRHRGRARRGHHPQRRLRHRHGAGRGRARRPGGGGRQARRDREVRGLAHGGLPFGPPHHPGAGEAPQAAGAGRSSSRAPRRTT